MKTKISNLMKAGFAGILFFALNGCSKDNMESSGINYGTLVDVSADGITTVKNASLTYALSDDFSFSEDEVGILLSIREEEKLARDVYAALYEKWGSPVFANISRAENTHMNAVTILLSSYNKEYSAVPDPGIFTASELQDLFAQLVEKGSESVGEAFKTGMLIEEMDIHDIAQSIQNVTNENILLVFENLTKGSRNHLRAFNRQLSALGITYTPVYLSQDEVNSIVATANESGKQYRMNRGRRSGNNSGKYCNL